MSKKPDPLSVLNCPSCGGIAHEEIEQENYVKHLNKMVRYSRVVCNNTNRSSWSGERCGMKTVAMPQPMATDTWNRRYHE